MPRAAIGIGSNLGDRRMRIAAALAALRRHPRIRSLRSARTIETDPVGGPTQGRFLNTAAAFQTDLDPRSLLDLLRAIEREQGRRPGPRWGARSLDLDLLFYGNACVRDAKLQLPHPRLHQRLFVLDPLAEIAPDWTHPLFGKTVRQLRNEVRGGKDRSCT